VSHPDLAADASTAAADFAEEYDAHLEAVIEQLNSADAAAFTPDLAVLDALVTSISIGEMDGEMGDETATHTEADLVFSLEEAGAQVALNTEPVPAADILTVSGHVINVNGEQLQLFIYEDATAAEADAERISADGYEIAPTRDGEEGPAIIDWPSPPHFYLWDNIIILYVGEDSEILTLLSELLGQPFAG
jgi:hypothetical protein